MIFQEGPSGIHFTYAENVILQQQEWDSFTYWELGHLGVFPLA